MRKSFDPEDSSLALPGGPTVLRACITSYHSNEEDVEALLSALG